MEILYIEKSSIKQRVRNYISISFSGTCAWWLSHVSVKITFKSTFLCSSGLNRALSSSLGRGATPIMPAKQKCWIIGYGMPRDTVVASYSIVHYNYAVCILCLGMPNNSPFAFLICILQTWLVASVKKFVHELQFLNGPLGNSRKKNNQGRLYGISRGRLIEEIASAISRG